LTCNYNCRAGAASGQGARLKEVFEGIARAAGRADRLEATMLGQGPETPARKPYVGPTAETIEALQRYWDDDAPHFAEVRRDFKTEICRDLDRRIDAIDDRLDKLTGTLDGRRQRRNFRVLPGGRGS
jgi:hypothetical protein